jgi:hypothetical protein
MSTPDSDSIVESGPPTEELYTNNTAQVPAVGAIDPTDSLADLDSLFADEQEDWPTHGPAKGFRVPWLAAVLLVLLVASVGIWGGAYMQRHSSSSTTSTASGFPFAALGGSSGSRTGGASGFPSSTSSNITSGTVTDIIGNTLYVTNASGNLVAVDVGSTTTVDRNAKSSLSAIQPGDTVTVQGTKGSGGSVTAASVSATQSGVSAGGFGGFGGFGGATSRAPSGSAG